MRLLFDIDAHGRVVPQSDELRRALADRAGRFALLPSAGDLLLARRTPPAGGPSPRPRCLLAGDLSGFPIADFVGFIHQARLSGVLTVAAGGVERAVAFQDGEVRSARSTAAGERIGEVAVRLGFVTESQVAQASVGGRPLGKTLVDKGFIAANDLWKCFHEQVTAVFQAILLSRDGTFFFVDEDASERPGAPVAVNTQSLLMDGIRRIDELSLFRARIPGASAYLRRTEPRRPITLKAVEQAVLGLVDGRRTVAQVATAAHLSEFDATKILYHLAEAGYVEALGGPATPADPGARAAATAAAMNELYRTILDAVPAEARGEVLAAERTFLGDPENAFAPVWTLLTPGPDGALEEDRLLANVAALQGAALLRLDPRGVPERVLLEALRELLLFLLFLAGERIGRAEDEALAAAARRTLAQLEGRS